MKLQFCGPTARSLTRSLAPPCIVKAVTVEGGVCVLCMSRNNGSSILGSPSSSSSSSSYHRQAMPVCQRPPTYMRESVSLGLCTLALLQYELWANGLCVLPAQPFVYTEQFKSMLQCCLQCGICLVLAPPLSFTPR